MVASSHTPESARWTPTPRPARPVDARILGRWSPSRASDVTIGRLQLDAALHDGRRPPCTTEAAVQRLVLVFEELVSNAVRHGRPPVEAVVTAIGRCWLLEVTDAAEDVPPCPDPGRDPALGGLGLGLVAQLSGGHGIASLGDGRKVVWASVDSTREDGQFSVG
jgi:signal transduction histidine kinase